jgi:hypothetical protein
MAHVHSADTRPICTVHAAHGLAGPASACAARDCAALRASAHRSGHRSLGAHRGAAGGGATMAEVEQGEALEHPRWRGHPPGKRVEAAAHRIFLPTGRVEKPRRQRHSPTRWGFQWLGWGGRGSSSASVFGEKGGKGGCSGLRSPWRGSRRRRWPDNGGGALRQRHSAQTATWSASDMRDGAVGTGVREARRGEGGIGNAVASLDTGRSETADRNGF